MGASLGTGAPSNAISRVECLFELKYATDSMHMTHRWLERCIKYLKDHPENYNFKQHFFPIVQGSTYKDLRKISAEYFCRRKNVLI